ncbi:MAG TPA: exodeoxyribonuclease VII small subunit [Spirochaetia bacterium]
MPAKGSDGRKAQAGFEQRLARLEKLAEKLRDGSIPLEEAVALFEEGMKLSKSLEKDLARVERRVEILTQEPQSETETETDEPGFELFPELGEDDGDEA